MALKDPETATRGCSSKEGSEVLRVLRVLGFRGLGFRI